MTRRTKRSSSTSARSTSVSVSPGASARAEFNPDYTDVKKDLKRIGTLAGIFVVVLIALAFII